MPRRPRPRRLFALPRSRGFRACGTTGPTRILSLDAWEALRLCDHQGLDQHAAAQTMGVSRPTLQRLLADARSLVARMLVEGGRLAIDMPERSELRCDDDRHRLMPGDAACPHCRKNSGFLIMPQERPR